MLEIGNGQTVLLNLIKIKKLSLFANPNKQVMLFEQMMKGNIFHELDNVVVMFNVFSKSEIASNISVKVGISPKIIPDIEL